MTSPPGLVVPVLVWMSTTPAVWKPYWAGSAPVIRVMLLAKREFDSLTEDRQALRQFHTIQAILNIGVLAAQMDLAKTVLCHTGGLQQHLVQLRVLPLGDRLQRLWREVIGARPEARLYLLAGHVKLLGNHVNIEGDRRLTGLVLCPRGCCHQGDAKAGRKQSGPIAHRLGPFPSARQTARVCLLWNVITYYLGAFGKPGLLVLLTWSTEWQRGPTQLAGPHNDNLSRWSARVLAHILVVGLLLIGLPRELPPSPPADQAFEMVFSQPRAHPMETMPESAPRQGRTSTAAG